MPTYEYVCRKCGHEFEQFQSIKDEPLKRCPKCKGAVKRKIGTGGGLLFKGSGFYITDYRSESYKQGAKSESAGSSTTATTDSKKPGPAKTEKSAAGSATKK